jgi:hypothetical protein
MVEFEGGLIRALQREGATIARNKELLKGYEKPLNDAQVRELKKTASGGAKNSPSKSHG